MVNEDERGALTGYLMMFFSSTDGYACIDFCFFRPSAWFYFSNRGFICCCCFFLALWCHLLHLPLSLCNNPIQINLKLEKLCEVNGFVRKELSVRDKVELFESLVNHNIWGSDPNLKIVSDSIQQIAMRTL